MLAAPTRSPGAGDGGESGGSREERRRFRLEEGFNSEEEKEMEREYQRVRQRDKSSRRHDERVDRTRREEEDARQRGHDRREERPGSLGRNRREETIRPPPSYGRRLRMDYSEAAAREDAVERSNTAPAAILYWFDNGDDDETIPGQFRSLDQFSKTLEFINPSNGPIHVGLAITEEKSLDNASKLQVPDPADLAKLKGPLSILADHGVDSGKQAVIALVVAHRMAKLLDIDRKEFKDIPASDRYKAFLVTSAYALSTYGLIGFYTKDEGSRVMDDKLTYCGGFISERDINKVDESQTHDYVFTKDVACDVKVERKQFWLDIIKTFMRTPGGKAV
jgi:hypothetical protein